MSHISKRHRNNLELFRTIFFNPETMSRYQGQNKTHTFGTLLQGMVMRKLMEKADQEEHKDRKYQMRKAEAYKMAEEDRKYQRELEREERNDRRKYDFLNKSEEMHSRRDKENRQYHEAQENKRHLWNLEEKRVSRAQKITDEERRLKEAEEREMKKKINLKRINAFKDPNEAEKFIKNPENYRFETRKSHIPILDKIGFKIPNPIGKDVLVAKRAK